MLIGTLVKQCPYDYCLVVLLYIAPKPIAGESDAVFWHNQPTRVVLTRQDEMCSLGLSIITRQVCTCVCVVLCVLYSIV